jgi:hypothetical protein
VIGESNTENSKKKVMDPKKQALLEKRKKYDPRAAIKNSKKTTVVETTSTIKQAPRDNGESDFALSTIPDKFIPDNTIEFDDAEDAQKDPNVPARPFLKRNKDKAVKLDKSQK